MDFNKSINIKLSILIAIIAGSIIVSSALTIGLLSLIQNLNFGDPIIILSDKRCKNCNSKKFEAKLNKLFSNTPVKIVDYSDGEGKELYENEKLKLLPVILLPKSIKKEKSFAVVSRFVKTGNDFFILKSGGEFDPKGEICNNGVDDDNNKLIDCDDPACKSAWACMEKRDKPVVDVFVMSHCPYGLQIERGIMPVWDLLEDKADINIRFCDYAMHKKKEIDEQLRQYCMQKSNKKQFKKYLKCFLTCGDSNKCLKEAKVNIAALKKCVRLTDKKFGVSRDFKNKKKWKGKFPSFNVEKGLVDKYRVKASPTLIVNDVVVTGRSPQDILNAVCLGFKDKPAECGEKLNIEKPKPGFGKGESD